MDTDDDQQLGIDAAEVVRIAVICAALVFNAIVFWDMVKERPEMLVLRQRARDAYDKLVAGPRRAARERRTFERRARFDIDQLPTTDQQQQ